MRSVPATLKAKLLDRVKSDSTANAPNLRIVATQSSVNTLLSEPIHEDVPPGLGDVTIRQMPGEREISLAYAICLENGRADIYQRKLPASMDYKWEFLSQYGPAEDVAIEFDGTWTMDPRKGWYFLQTEEYPYIFTVEGGNLYVQYWNDPSTRALLAEQVSQISACKGWKNSIDLNLDQGLLIGYLRDGQVFYRALCTQPDGSKVWEAERQVEALGSGNTTLAVVRTNDFRVGFLTEQTGGAIRLVLTHRTWAGMSVRPETVHVHVKPSFLFFEPYKHILYAKREHGQVGIAKPYFNFDESPETPEIAITKVERLNRTEAFNSYGCKVFFDQPLYGEVDAAFVPRVTLKATMGTNVKTVPITRVELVSSEQALVFHFSEDLRRVYPLALSFPSNRSLWYQRLPQYRWFLPAATVTIPAENNNVQVSDASNYTQVGVSTAFEIVGAEFHAFNPTDHASVSVVGLFSLVPAQAQPI